MKLEQQDNDTLVKADCYSDGERRAMVWTQQVRARMLLPLLKLLAGCGVRPDHLTLASLLWGLAFCPLYFWSPAVAFIALALHVLLDGIDGPLARHLDVASRKGSFTDTMADQIVVVATTVTLMVAKTLGIPAGGLYIFLYTVVVALAMVRNALAIPYWWLVRPRFVVYVWFLVETWLWPGSIDSVIWAFNVLLAYKMLTGFRRVRRSI